MEKTVTLILGNQLFAPKHYRPFKEGYFFMAEDHELCTHFRYHKHKILLFLIAMRRYRDELQEEDFNIHYEEFPKTNSGSKKASFTERLSRYIEDNGIQKLRVFEIEDKFFEDKIIKLTKKLKIELEVMQSPFFMVTREKFKTYLGSVKSPFMKTFYERLRKKTGILMDSNGKPTGGKYSYDSENRNKLPKDLDPPPLIFPKPDKTPHFKEVSEIIEKNFSDHPGECSDFWLATTRKEALKVFNRFLNERLSGFGTYQDSITNRSDFLYHSVVSPYINMGLILPEEAISSVEKAYKKDKAPLNSCEGFIRQVLGWREFVRGIYQEFDEQQQVDNFFDHKVELSPSWYEATTGIPPLDDAISKANKTGYNHHIERLMVVSNLMLLCQINPQEVYKWFMEMFVDSSDWVMGPNVFGMGQFSDGGIFATKPYICGSNYLLKMSDYKKGPWCDVVDGLYWQFIERNLTFFEGNPRLGMMARTFKKMGEERKETIYQAADNFIKNDFKV
jgi:deoxyribodipyrimidine photolyase-related protein